MNKSIEFGAEGLDLLEKYTGVDKKRLVVKYLSLVFKAGEPAFVEQVAVFLLKLVERG